MKKISLNMKSFKKQIIFIKLLTVEALLIILSTFL